MNDRIVCVSVSWDETFGCWVAEHPLHANLLGRGRTREEARAELALAIDRAERDPLPRRQDYNIDEVTPAMFPFAKLSTW